MTACSSCSPSHDSSGFTAGFFLGLLIGGAGGYLLTTAKGKELLATLKAVSAEKLEKLAENPALADKLQELETTMAQARSTASPALAPKPKKNLFFRRS